MSSEHRNTTMSRPTGIDHSSEAPPLTIPPGHVGEFVIPGTGRRVWWTGRVAIGLLHQPERYVESSAQSCRLTTDSEALSPTTSSTLSA